mmetsp:Transcript_19844/g.42269  ORF Transcript_19844/g.42269 Transcript_19844/m.42269 type:complete len:408 (-) Transcript_19844:47-1270(-)
MWGACCEGAGSGGKARELLPRSRKGQKGYGTALPPRKPREWEAQGQPWNLLQGAVLTVAIQCLPLALIAGQFFFPSPHLMKCNPLDVGQSLAGLCEWTKTYVRCFPLLGLVVALLVASRTFFLQRIYYELLRRVALVDFENFKPYRDPLFLILLWCVANAFLHFALCFATSKHGDVTNAVEGVKQLASFYLVPACLFLVFLWKAYDIEAALLPLSKYIEEDTEAARSELVRMPVIPEAMAANIAGPAGPVLGDASFQTGKGKGSTRDDDLLGDFIRHAEAHIGTKDSERGVAFPPPNGWKENQQPLSRWRLAIGDNWASALLLDERLLDENSTLFKRTWRIFYLIACAIMIAVFVCFVYQAYKDVVDVTGINGEPAQKEDALSLTVMAGHALLVAFLSYGFLRRGGA